MKKLIAPSILSANFACLGEEVRHVLRAGADMIHFDVMDNHYVPNLSFGPMVLKSLRKEGIIAPIDVHLMVKPVDALIGAFIEAGADSITFHPEASAHIDRSLQLIKAAGCKAGLALNPATPLDGLTYVLEKIDLLLIMSVNPGFGGQKFLSLALKKLEQAKKLISEAKQDIQLQIDGGITVHNIADAARAGADIFVVGSAIFWQKDYTKVLNAMRQELSSV